MLATSHTALAHRFAEANGVRLHYASAGPPDGELVVLLHGWPQTWYAWRQVIGPLADAGYRVVAIDYRGAGASEKPHGGYDKITMAQDVRALVRTLGDDGGVTLVARDIGVMLAYAYAAQWPEEVERLVLLDVPVPGTKVWYEAKRDPLTWHFALHQQRDVAEMLVAGREYEYIRDFYKRRIHVESAVSDEDIAVYARGYASPGGLRAGFELYRAFPDDERQFAELLKRKLPMPVLALAGEQSNGPRIEEMARELADDVRGGVAPETGHWLPEENPTYLLDQLLAFLEAAGEQPATIRDGDDRRGDEHVYQLTQRDHSA